VTGEEKEKKSGYRRVALAKRKGLQNLISGIDAVGKRKKVGSWGEVSMVPCCFDRRVVRLRAEMDLEAKS
jgi:hypothetical protein